MVTVGLHFKEEFNSCLQLTGISWQSLVADLFWLDEMRLTRPASTKVQSITVTSMLQSRGRTLIYFIIIRRLILLCRSDGALDVSDAHQYGQREVCVCHA
jgi:hypothetical protein